MKMLKVILAALALGAAATAQAGTYSTVYSFGSYEDGNLRVEMDPDPLVATGPWQIDIDALTFSGSLAYPASHLRLTINAGDPVYEGSLDLYQAEATQYFAMNPSSTASYDAATRTFSVTDITMSTDAAGPVSCTATGLLSCEGVGPRYARLDLVFVFDESLRSFDGMAYEYFEGLGMMPSFNVTGTMVPVPAAAWLFGSGLLGLAGLAHRRTTI